MRNYGFLGLLLFIPFFMMSGNHNYPRTWDGCIRLMTYNVAYARGNTGHSGFMTAKVDEVGVVIKMLDPDIVALQELDSACAERYYRYLLKDIKEATGKDYQLIYTSVMPYNTGNIGNGILVKSELTVSRIKVLKVGSEKPITRIDLDRFTFFNAHLHVDCVECRQQSAAVLNSELKYIRKPSFLAGDLNDSHRWGGGAFPLLIDNDWILSSTLEPTIPGNPSTIDYILYHDYNNSGLKLGNSDPVTVLTLPERIVNVGEVSDHYPVYLDIKLPDQTDLDVVNENKPFIYPSQTSDYLYVGNEMVFDQIQIYTLDGVLVKRFLQEHKLDVSELVPGYYYVSMLGMDVNAATLFEKK